MRALFVYSNEAKTGLSAKAQKIEDGFRNAGYNVDAIYFSSSGHRTSRVYEWLKTNSLFIYSVTAVRYDVIYVRYAYYFGLIYLAAWLLGRPLQIEVNSNVQGELLQRGQTLRARYDQLAMWIACHAATRIHVVSKQLEQLYRNAYPKACVIFNPNFVVSEAMPSHRVLGNTDVVNLVFLGNASQPWHGMENFIRKVIVGNQWFAANCALHLIGERTAQIDGLVAKHRLQDIVIAYGFLVGEAKALILQTMDVGIGGFDLGIIGLTETTSIKNGEYLHCGLALLLGYEDPACPLELNFVGKLTLDADDARSKFEAYIRRIRATRDLRLTTHEYAKHHLLVEHYINKIIAS